jgi:hypothetical protein
LRREDAHHAGRLAGRTQVETIEHPVGQRRLVHGRVKRAVLLRHIVEVLRFAAHVALRVEVVHG